MTLIGKLGLGGQCPYYWFCKTDLFEEGSERKERGGQIYSTWRFDLPLNKTPTPTINIIIVF